MVVLVLSLCSLFSCTKFIHVLSYFSFVLLVCDTSSVPKGGVVHVLFLLSVFSVSYFLYHMCGVEEAY